ncbi:MAG TPA: hypothetical protein VIL17_03805 [Coriobacteriia bacterium]
MSEYNDSREAFVDGVRVDMPPVAGEDALTRVKMRALRSQRASVESPLRQRSWRMAGGLAAAVAVIAVAAVALAPGQQSAAFARGKAAEALLFQVPGRVLHLEMTYTQKDKSTTGDVLYNTNERWSVWVDAEGKRLREELVDSSDGSLNEIHVRTSERDIVFHAKYPADARLVEYDATDQRIETPLDDWIPYMRAQIADGSAKVAGTKTIDGDEYWVVTCSSGDGADDKMTVTMRKSDYLLKTWVRDNPYEVDGKSGVISKGATLQVIEQLDPATLPSDFFSPDAVRDAAKQGTPVEKP